MSSTQDSDFSYRSWFNSSKWKTALYVGLPVLSVGVICILMWRRQSTKNLEEAEPESAGIPVLVWTARYDYMYLIFSSRFWLFHELFQMPLRYLFIIYYDGDERMVNLYFKDKKQKNRVGLINGRYVDLLRDQLEICNTSPPELLIVTIVVDQYGSERCFAHHTLLVQKYACPLILRSPLYILHDI